MAVLSVNKNYGSKIHQSHIIHACSIYLKEQIIDMACIYRLCGKSIPYRDDKLSFFDNRNLIVQNQILIEAQSVPGDAHRTYSTKSAA